MKKEIKVGDIVRREGTTTPLEVQQVVEPLIGWTYAEMRILFGPYAGLSTRESVLRLEHYTQEKSHD